MKILTFSVMFVLAISLLSACGGGKNEGNEGSTSTGHIVETTMEPVKEQPRVDNYHGIKPASVDTMEMVIDRHGNVVGRFISNNANTYSIAVQDVVEVSKIGNKVVTFRAKDGQGILYTQRKNINIRQEPTLDSKVIGQISYKDGFVPETFPCLGKTDEWFQIKVGNIVGYVRHDLVIWDGMDSF